MNKEKIYKAIESPDDKLFAVDFDGTISNGDFTPIQEKIDFVNNLYERGAHIVIYTARFPNEFEMVNSWLFNHNVKFHGIAMRNKINADVYIDNRAINVDDLKI